MILKCLNKDCQRFDDEILIPEVTLRLVDGKLIPVDAKCSLCNSQLEAVDKDGMPYVKKPFKDRGKSYYEKKPV
jgi:DNA anti-recombination protein RmuC